MTYLPHFVLHFMPITAILIKLLSQSSCARENKHRLYLVFKRENLNILIGKQMKSVNKLYYQDQDDVNYSHVLKGCVKSQNNLALKANNPDSGLFDCLIYKLSKCHIRP